MRSKTPAAASHRRRSLSDPLSKALLPPLDETPAEQALRIQREREAKKVSDDIDEQIGRDKVALKKQRNAIKILLLGQSESGKSTTLKQFQLLHDPTAFHAERVAWRPVIYLNLIRTIRRILEALLPPPPPNDLSTAPSSSPPPGNFFPIQQHQQQSSSRYAAYQYQLPSSTYQYDDPAYDTNASNMESFAHEGTRSPSLNPIGSSSSAGISDNLLKRLRAYERRLTPLLELEQRLMRQLSFPEEDDDPPRGQFQSSWQWNSEGVSSPIQAPPPLSLPSTSASSTSSYVTSISYPTTAASTSYSHSYANHSYANTSPYPTITPNAINASPSFSAASTPSPISPVPSLALSPTKGGELALRTTSNWKKSFALTAKLTMTSRAPKSVHTGELSGWWEDPDDPVHVLNACAHGEYGMIALWKDPDVRNLLNKRRVRMEEHSGFYLNDIERITNKIYIPKDDDVLKARLKTVGVVEHSFTITSSDRTGEWKIYDVGGARHQRQAWAPYFDDVNAIIFLAPISAFDQTLAEDPRVNRLQDSMLLWRYVVSNKLLQNVNIILFLNKCDLLKNKLESGVSLAYHMTSYGNRPNDYESVSKYFKNKFAALHHQHSPNRERDLFIHMTSVIDKTKTSIIISNVRDLILRENLQSSRLL